MTDLLLGLGVLLVALAVVLVVHLAREQRIETRSVRALALVCAGALLVMLLSDWPSEVLSAFWADHSVLAGILSSVLLVGVVFLAFEDSERRRQERLDASVTSAGLGGIVDHVVDVEVAVALLSDEGPPQQQGWEGWAEPGKPLRWLRNERTRLSRTDGGGPRDVDPRSSEPVIPGVGDPTPWRTELVDQAVRRLLAAIRDWSPVIRGSRNGIMVLIAISEVRKDLMEGLSYRLGDPSDDPTTLLVSLRQRLRLLAAFMEDQSGARPPRPEVLQTGWPLPPTRADLEWAADEDGRGTFDHTWQTRLRETRERLDS